MSLATLYNGNPHKANDKSIIRLEDRIRLSLASDEDMVGRYGAFGRTDRKRADIKMPNGYFPYYGFTHLIPESWDLTPTSEAPGNAKTVLWNIHGWTSRKTVYLALFIIGDEYYVVAWHHKLPGWEVLLKRKVVKGIPCTWEFYVEWKLENGRIGIIRNGQEVYDQKRPVGFLDSRPPYEKMALYINNWSDVNYRYYDILEYNSITDLRQCLLTDVSNYNL